jgi:hypothetical protein
MTLATSLVNRRHRHCQAWKWEFKDWDKSFGCRTEPLPRLEKEGLLQHVSVVQINTATPLKNE